MKILFRYILREYLIPLGYCLAGFISIYSLFELFGSFSRLLEAKLPAGLVLRYFAGYLSPFFHYLAPAALMLAALYTMWNFCRHSELVAMRASGVSFAAIARPILLVATLMAAFVAWVNECYVPGHAQWAKRLRAEHFELKKLERNSSVEYRNSRALRTWNIGSVEDADGEHLLNVKVMIDRENGAGPEKSVIAERADYLDGEWWFKNPEIHHYSSSGVEIASDTPEFDSLGLRVFPEFHERPSDILLQNLERRYKSVRSKLRFARRNVDLSEEAKREWYFDAYAQAVSPLACVIITLFAIPAGVASGRQSVFKSIVGVLLLFFAYYGATIGGMVAAYQGWIPPLPAALLPPILFFLYGIFNFRRHR